VFLEVGNVRNGREFAFILDEDEPERDWRLIALAARSRAWYWMHDRDIS